MSEPLPTREAAQRLGISQAWLLKLARQAGVGQRRRHARGRGWGFDDDALAAIDGLRRQGPWVGHGQASAPETLAAITAISEGLRLADAATIVGIAPKTLSARLAVLGLSVREIQATPLLHEMRLSPAALRDARARAGLSQAALAERIGVATVDAVRRWEHGLSAPSAVLTLRLLVALDVSPRRLLAPAASL